VFVLGSGCEERHVVVRSDDCFDGKDDDIRRMKCWLVSWLLQDEVDCISYWQRYHEGEINT
jgi:hypothetical protein